MPGVILDRAGSNKRKRDSGETTTRKIAKSRKAPKTATGETAQSQILLLEEQILDSRAHYNNVVQLQAIAADYDKKPKTATLAAVALCRVFCRLVAGESLVPQTNSTDAEAQVVYWLKDRLKDYVELLLSWFGSSDGAQESTALTLLMRLVKEEASQGTKRSEQAWRTSNGVFAKTVRKLVEVNDADLARETFVDKFVEEYDDVRFFTFLVVKQILCDEQAREHVHIGNVLDIFSKIEGVPESDEMLKNWYGDSENIKQLRSLSSHRKVAQEAWLCVFRAALSRDQRKSILNKMASQVLPWFSNRVELLVDLLTDSFNGGGSLALLALSGIFYLMTEKNLDYPDFYTKLYSLVDQDIMHSKHRSRFFRLLEKFMASSHLPATMVASFIKRLSRLSLQAPPGGIVFTIPWTYNMLKQHPACTFMIHRTYHPAHGIYQNHQEYQEQGMDDPYDMTEPDPVKTGAIESSLWELETLQSHYHPNVATLAKIIGEQFTKREYQLEDFLDHSYATLLDAELSRKLKKAPVVEWEIPKRIVSAEHTGLNRMGELLQSAIGGSNL